MKHCCWHGICGRKTDREIRAFSRKFELDLWENQWIDWTEIISACSTILYACFMKFWKKSDKRLLSNNFWKNRSGGRRGGLRDIWRSNVFEIYGNFEVKLFSALGIETIEIDVLRTIESILHKSKRNKKSGHWEPRMQQNTSYCFEKGTFDS